MTNNSSNATPPTGNNKQPSGNSNANNNIAPATPTVESLSNKERKFNKETASLSDVEKTKRTIIGMHQDGKLGDYINKIISQFGLYITIAAMLILAPAMPVIFYLTVLYNVILVTWENFKALDTDNIKE